MSAEGALGVVLVTGVAHYLGAHLAGVLAGDRRVGRVLGIDSLAPPEDLRAVLGGVEVRRLDLRDPAMTSLMVDEEVEVVAHVGVATTPEPGPGGRQAMKEHNVIGTMKLLAACQQAPGLRGLVVRSSTAAYGASFRDPAVFTEDTEPLELPRGGFARDVLDIEGYVRGFHRRRPEPRITVLRFAPFVGSYTETSLTRYFAQPVVPTVLGRDPRLQFVHIKDGLDVLHRSVVESHPGTFNVAGRGVLSLSQALRRAGRIAAPVAEQGLDLAAAVPQSVGGSEFTRDRLDLLVHGRVVDTRRLIQEFGLTPRSTAVAFDDFVRHHRRGALLRPDKVRAAEKLLLERVRRARSLIQDWGRILDG
ncbi:MAG: NAD-dependent epimerase/dehydratase family protein [Dactylosporangium sp.]|nr:NAD-dependent epimerase/dehydratase family protein [Dactylosporangium sp.]NNJ61713.1 NAD-dependent epimerase/dehydratase family protein [Dactylosporangium sp.]